MRGLLFLMALCLSFSSAQAQSARRVALVIGVGGYEHVPHLDHAPEDARRVLTALRATGFDAPEALIDPTVDQLETALLAFSERARHAEVAVLYFAGHGLRHFDENWLLPKDASLDNPQNLRAQGVRLSDIVGYMEEADLSIIFVDACRENPFLVRWRNRGGVPRSASAGLGAVAAEQLRGTVLAFSARPGRTTPDNGVYARVLSEQVQLEGLELRQVLDRVRREVRAEAERLFPEAPAPEPEAVWGVDTGAFYFLPPRAPAERPLAFVPPDQAQDARETPSDVRALLVRGEDVPRLRDFALFRECDVCPEMVVLPAGTLLMGSPQDETGRGDDEDTVRGSGEELVRVSVQRFALGRFELMAQEWFACVDADGGCDEGARGRLRLPITQVSWNDVRPYLSWLNAQSGGGATLASAGGAGAYRLPSEAEWEYAARAGTASAYAFGDDPANLGEYAWFGANADRRVHDVGGRRANQFGLYDMYGNVWEWVRDCYVDSYAQSSGQWSANTTDNCSSHVRRGGSWHSIAGDRRFSDREGSSPDHRGLNYGFRVAKTLN